MDLGNIRFQLYLMAAGAVLSVIGSARRGAANSFASAPRARLSGLRRGQRAVTSGEAWSPFPLTAPVSRKECVFYIEEVSERRASGGDYNAYRPTLAMADNAHGAFFIKDGGSEALVLPTFRSADINKAFDEASTEIYEENLKSEIRAEKCIAAGETVSVLGTPRTLAELLAWLRGGASGGLNSSLLDELLRREKEGSSLLCFFGDGVERVSDQPPAEYAERARSGASTLVWLGAALLVAGAAWLLVALSGGSAAPSAY